MFEKATRLKLRFPFRGQCSTEDLWDLGVRQLDEIYKALNGQLKAQQGDSLLDEKSDANETLELQINIVKHIVSVKLAEAEARENAAVRAAKKQKLLAKIEAKQDAALDDMSIEELQGLAAEL